MRIRQVRHHVLRSIEAVSLEPYQQGAPFAQLRTDPTVRNHWISFTALDWNAAEGCLYAGLTAFDCELLWRFHPDEAHFEALGFSRVAEDPQYVKIHRGLTPDGKGGYYFGTAALPDLDERNSAPGGAVFHYGDGRFECLGIPRSHDYIQNIEVDLARQRVYGVTYPVMYFFDYDLNARSTDFSFFTGSHFHESGLDDAGYLWGSWAARRGHCLFRYHPDRRQPEFFSDPIPNLDANHLFTFPMNGPIDSFINGGDGFLYFGTTLGELHRLNPASGKHELLGKPSAGIRLSGLVPGPGGALLGSYGSYYETGLFIFDVCKATFTDLGRMRDGEERCFMIHDIAWDGGERVFAAETDNTDRSGWLWEALIG